MSELSAPGFSLRLEFASDTRRVGLLSPSSHADQLRRLAAQFPSSRQVTSGRAEVDLDDLLLRLRALASWEDPMGVVWEPALAEVIKDTSVDARVVAQRLESPLEPDVEVDLRPALGEDWVADLTDFQRRDLQRLAALRHGANFSVPGAGKTRVALALFQLFRARGEVGRLLIVGPKSSFESWEYEGRVCFASPLEIGRVQQHVDASREALLVNYERLANVTLELSAWLHAVPSMMILDEAHRMKLGANGVYGAACLALGPRARHRLILTGTPAPNGSTDLENLFGFVWPGQGRRQVTQAVAGGDLREASRVLRPLFTRTTKAELKLPPVTTSIRHLEMPSIHREVYDALIGQFSARALGSEADFGALGRVIVYLLMAATSPALLATGSTRYEPLAYRVPPLPVPDGSRLNDLLRDLPDYEFSPKYKEVLAIVASNAAQGRKTLVWSTFIRSLTTLQELLGLYQPAVIHGGTVDREAELERFRKSADCAVLLSNPATLGEGISLHHDCHDAVFVDRDFAAGRFLQSLDRIHRLGMDPTEETNVTVLASDRTIDDVVAERLAWKLDFMGSILDDEAVRQLGELSDEEDVGSGLDAEDVRLLLRHVDARPA